MKARATFVAFVFTTGLAVAQDNPPQPAQQPEQAKTEQKTEQQTTVSKSSDRPAEMKTMTYRGTLVDLGCGASQNTAATAPAAPDAATSANRSASDTANCNLSTSSTQFGMKMDNGQTV